MTPAQRCDEIIRMIDEVLDGALHAEHGLAPTPPLLGPSIELPLTLTHHESWANLESRA
ncbi:MAG TPA: hypothetical protein VMU64_03140 [Acidimicrobiales bacterium]|nr:hypothetical protein [Acidimicrobiales bacterium]